jgi:steroid 5-alpha reductase family enzyme
MHAFTVWLYLHIQHALRVVGVAFFTLAFVAFFTRVGTDWFLVHHTGIPLTEQASLERRGEVYRKYQLEVSRFFPRFPRAS